MMIKLGVCRGIEDAAAAYEAGFDYIECCFSQVMTLPDTEFKEWKQKLADSPIPCMAMNIMLPGRFRLTGPEADLKPVHEYLSSTMERAAEIELPLLVFGSGGARNVPVDAQGCMTFPMDKALDQIYEYLVMAGGIAEQNGVTIVIEPLRAKECNIIQLVSEGAEMARRVNLPNVKLLADLTHMADMNDDMQSIVDARDIMRHCHVSNPNGRIFPQPGDGWDYSPFFNALKSIDYCGGVSIEAGCDDFASQIRPAFEVLDGYRR